MVSRFVFMTLRVLTLAGPSAGLADVAPFSYFDWNVAKLF